MSAYFPFLYIISIVKFGSLFSCIAFSTSFAACLNSHLCFPGVFVHSFAVLYRIFDAIAYWCEECLGLAFSVSCAPFSVLVVAASSISIFCVP